MIKAVIFDLGNVIVNVHFDRAARKLSQHSNLKPEQVITQIFDSKQRKEFERGFLSEQEFYKFVRKKSGTLLDFPHFHNWLTDMFTLKTGSEDVIKKLKNNYRLVLLSNTNKAHYEYIMEKFPIINEFDEYVLSYMEGMLKPNPFIFLEAVKKAGVKPWECLYFDDVLPYVCAARCVGIKAYRYTTHQKLIKDLTKHDVGI